MCRAASSCQKVRNKMFHTDIYISKNGSKERHIHSHYNYTSETIAAVRIAVVRIGQQEKYRGPYDVHIHTEDDHGNYISEAEFRMDLTDNFKSAFVKGPYKDK